jgi:hypothetical protein
MSYTRTRLRGTADRTISYSGGKNVVKFQAQMICELNQPTSIHPVTPTKGLYGIILEEIVVFWKVTVSVILGKMFI